MQRTNVWTPRGESGSGGCVCVCVMNWAIGIDIYTLICMKWITITNLLYKKINKIQKIQKIKKRVAGLFGMRKKKKIGNQSSKPNDLILCVSTQPLKPIRFYNKMR